MLRIDELFDLIAMDRVALILQEPVDLAFVVNEKTSMRERKMTIQSSIPQVLLLPTKALEPIRNLIVKFKWTAEALPAI